MTSVPRPIVLLAAALLAAAPAVASAQGDAAAGKIVSSKCTICHSLTAGKNGIGPSLAGVVGRKSGSVPGFKYSPAMAAIGLTWNAETLDKYLTNPRATVPGTKMIFAGLPKPEDRANLIAYLSQAGAAATGK